MNVLVLNTGSSSLKFQVIDTDPETMASDTDRRIAKGTIERIGSQGLLRFQNSAGRVTRNAQPVRDHRAAIDIAVRWLVSPEADIPQINSLADIHAVGHRVVHGGEKFSKSVLIDDDVLRGIDDCIELAPLHNPANVQGIQAARNTFGRALPQAAVFDTAFHQTLPDTAYLYAIPY